MPVKTITTYSWVKACPNQAKHDEDRVKRITEEIQNGKSPFPMLECIEPQKGESVFCAICGAKLVTETVEHLRQVCAHCGMKIYHADSYCPGCGDPVKEEVKNG